MPDHTQYSQAIRALEELEKKISFEEDRRVEWKIGDDEVPVPVWTLENRRNDYSVVKAFVRGGTKFPRHTHAQKEFIVCTKGQAIYRAGSTKDHMSVIKTLLRGDCVSIKAERIHEIEAIEDTWFVVVTVPDSEAFAK